MESLELEFDAGEASLVLGLADERPGREPRLEGRSIGARDRAQGGLDELDPSDALGIGDGDLARVDQPLEALLELEQQGPGVVPLRLRQLLLALGPAREAQEIGAGVTGLADHHQQAGAPGSGVEIAGGVEQDPARAGELGEQRLVIEGGEAREHVALVFDDVRGRGEVSHLRAPTQG